MDKQIEQQLSNRIANWKKNLIDMSKRNTLLNFKPKKTNSVNFLDAPSYLYESLVGEEKQLDCDKLATQFSQQIEKIKSMTIEELEKKKRIAEETQNYNKILNKLRTAAKTRMNEQGINISYLSFGVLKWKETQLSTSSDFLAPLLLVPATLKRTSANAPFTLNQFEDEIVINPFLAHMLQEQHGITLPELPEDSASISVNDLWAEIRELVINLEGWSVEEDVYLSLFSFNKLVMYKDMETYKDIIESHPLIREIAGVSNEESRKQTFDHTRVPDETSMDRDVPSHEIFNILDADSSQQQAILAAKNEMSFVLQGPPGTGKSQTISNIIAENLANNKKVLFVSEKMAALNVVKSRLESEGLGDFCIEMHSQKANKRQVLDEINHVLNIQESNKKISKEVYSQINVIREKLNTYSEKVHLAREPYDKSVYEVHGILSRLQNVPEFTVDFSISPTTELESIYRLLSDLERYRASVYKSNFHPWEGYNDESFSLEIKSKVKKFLEKMRDQVENTTKVASDIEYSTGLKISTLDELKKATNILDMAKHSPMPPMGWFNKGDISQIIIDAKNYQERFSSFLDDKKKLTTRVNENILEESSLQDLYNELYIENEQLISMIPETKLNELLLTKSALINGIDDILQFFSNASDYAEIASRLGIQQLENAKELSQLLRYLTLLNQSVTPTEDWFDEKRLANLLNQAMNTKEKYLENTSLRSILLSKYNPSFLEINAEKALIDFDVSESLVESFRSTQRSGLEDINLYNQKSKVKSLLGDFFSITKLLNTYKMEFESLFGVELTNLSLIDNLEIVIKFIERSPKPLESWFDLNNYRDIQTTIREGKELFSKYQIEFDKFTKVFEEEAYDERIYDIFERCEGQYQSFLRVFNGSYKKDLKWLKCNLKSNEKLDFDTFQKNVRNIKRVMDYKNSINKMESELQTSLGWHYQASDTNWYTIEQALSTTREIVEWHQGRSMTVSLRELLLRPAGKIEELKTSFTQIKQLSNDLEKNINLIQNEFPNLMNLSGTDASKVNLEQLFSKLQIGSENVNSYFIFVDEFSKHLLNPMSLNVISLKQDLKKVIILKQKSTELDESYESNMNILGSSFKGNDTEWDMLIRFIGEFNLLFKSNIQITQEFKKAMLSGEEFSVDIAPLVQCLSSIEKEIPKYRETLPKFFSGYEGPELYWPYNEFGNTLTSIKRLVEEWQYGFSKIGSYFMNNDLTFDEIRNTLEMAVRVKIYKQLIDNELENLKVVFGDRFTGYNTNWEQIFDALAWTDEWHGLFNNIEMPTKLLDYVTSEGNGNKSDIMEWLEQAEKELEKNMDLQKDLHLYFTVSVIFKELDFSELKLVELIHFSEVRIDSIDLLEDWIRYRRLEDHASNLGLDKFMLAIKNESIGDFTFKDLFQKRFFTLWLDQIYKNEPLLFDFDAEEMNTDVTTFRKLDVKSNQLNVHRIKERLESNRNHAVNSLAFRRELQIIQAEIGKKKRHYPIRKLLNLTASLFMEIKPCLLMSPLSVSQFLDASVIQFDLVIFDEASQIFSEDAIGAIVRGKQLIVVGDTKQLPPTNFFHSSTIEEDFDDEQEEDQEVSYESILDECAHVLPPINLRWHYRSKHESLITFSNEAFYHNNLITFPSSDNGPYLGTEFVYVEDGVYDRGGNKTNKKEAEQIANLVFEHFKEHPNQSLGVIAFSEAQASAIENELTILRNANPLFERFFQEGAHEEYFIKSLENVQGDERDVIFLSVGYAKAADQTLHYNFGPLSKARGERRLNVAVTRAKYHMKLISSLKPSDLSDVKVSGNTGLRLLKDYMQTTMDGKLPISMTSHKEMEFDSPFEEDVFNVLTDMGYKVKTQVGCSGYRIDLAIVDPLNDNKFLLGIECDGKAYHSSKVARDRDRLRQQVLEGLGWKIYRIWSQEWFKKRRFEVNRLENYLETIRYLV
ncbi:hypothetical protein CA600_21150 [Paenibacillus sp. VTT E-133280]|uniref:DUF4011 domain-containing protein n=1 Tax=Paenibacillus sp. VTT E-133280 TaxID=1986222 RepID=UPI000BA148E0|nr:DUF4011 domain-containing protein [Paenibacillus sp. VTT E-133280]OZQ62773.1 hypothetical protein CA600_21150 [Paenibacillus sp. VTT E-133280]